MYTHRCIKEQTTRPAAIQYINATSHSFLRSRYCPYLNGFVSRAHNSPASTEVRRRLNAPAPVFGDATRARNTNKRSANRRLSVARHRNDVLLCKNDVRPIAVSIIIIFVVKIHRAHITVPLHWRYVTQTRTLSVDFTNVVLLRVTCNLGAFCLVKSIKSSYIIQTKTRYCARYVSFPCMKDECAQSSL